MQSVVHWFAKDGRKYQQMISFGNVKSWLREIPFHSIIDPLENTFGIHAASGFTKYGLVAWKEVARSFVDPTRVRKKFQII